MKLYSYMPNELAKLAQQVLDHAMALKPSESAPEGFQWHPIVSITETKDTLNFEVEWVAKKV